MLRFKPIIRRLTVDFDGAEFFCRFLKIQHQRLVVFQEFKLNDSRRRNALIRADRQVEAEIIAQPAQDGFPMLSQLLRDSRPQALDQRRLRHDSTRQQQDCQQSQSIKQSPAQHNILCSVSSWFDSLVWGRARSDSPPSQKGLKRVL